MEGNPNEKDSSFVVEKMLKNSLLSFTFNDSISAKGKKDTVDKNDIQKF